MTTTASSTYVVLGVTYLILDALWIYGMSASLYYPMVLRIQSSPMVPRLVYALGAYLLLLLALFGVCAPLRSHYKDHLKYSETTATLLSYSLVGFLIYGIYNFTNATIFKEYPAYIILVDSLWGALVFTAVGVVHGKLER